MKPATESGWHGVKLFHRSLYDALLWNLIKSVNTPVFWLLLSSACVASKLPLFPTLSLWVGKGWARNWEELQPGLLTWADQRDIPYHIMFCSVIKTQGKEEEGRHSWLWCLSSQGTIMCDEALPLWKWLDICLRMGNGEQILSFLCLCGQFLLSLLDFYLSPWVFLPFHYFLCIQQERGVSEWLYGCLAVGQGQATTSSQD